MGIPLFENRKVTKFPFNIFDRYEIHIQGFVDLTNLHHFPTLIFTKYDNEWGTLNFSKTKTGQKHDTILSNIFKRNKVSGFPCLHKSYVSKMAQAKTCCHNIPFAKLTFGKNSKTRKLENSKTRQLEN